MVRSRRADPDYPLEADRGAAPALSTKRAVLVHPDELAARAAAREGARELDQAVEALPGLRRQRRDRERAMPRDVTADIGHPAMVRTLPEPDALRIPPSSRQRKARAITKRAAQDALPQAQYDALARLVTDTAFRTRINNTLSDATGDAQELPDTQRAQVQRVDRAIQQYERRNPRGHVIYVNLELPAGARGGDPLGVLRSYFPPGGDVAFDRFTAGAHALHEIEPPGGGQYLPAFEIQTRRGMYLGRSDSLDDTTHLLPRGMRFRVVSTHEASYRRPDGTRGRRPVIQLRDLGED